MKAAVIIIETIIAYILGCCLFAPAIGVIILMAAFESKRPGSKCG